MAEKTLLLFGTILPNDLFTKTRSVQAADDKMNTKTQLCTTRRPNEKRASPTTDRSNETARTRIYVNYETLSRCYLHN